MPRHVYGHGPLPCEFFVCGEGPGWQEDAAGLPFVGKTGAELDRHLDGNELPAREDCYLTNVFREYRGKDYIWTAQDLAESEPELLNELAECQPKVIITLGRYAARFFMGDVDMDEVWGLPWLLPAVDKFDFLDNSTVVFPIHHPASGFHNSEMSAYVVAGFRQLAQFLDGQLEPRRLYDDPLAGKEHYDELTTSRQVQRVTHCWSAHTNVALDTEGVPGKPWSLQFSTEPGRAYLIRANRGDLLAEFSGALHRIRPRLTFHSALYDLSMGRSLGIDFSGLDFDDTMVMAYLLQIEPQGLKALCTRHANMQMQSYEELTAEPGQRLAVNWLTTVYDIEHDYWEKACEEEYTRLTTTPYIDSRGKERPGRKLKVHPKLPKTPLDKAVTRCLQSKDARKLWGNQVEDIKVDGYRRLGQLPSPTLDYVQPATAVHYGCRDADGTTRVRAELGPRIDALGLRGVYELELGTYPLIERMSYIGIKPDLEHFRLLSERLDKEITTLRSKIANTAQRVDFNANSGDQVAAYLFDDLNLEGNKRTRSGRYSTNDKILEGLEKEFGVRYPVISDIRAYREYYKLKNTFCDVIPDLIKGWPHDGRVHCAFRTTRTPTGRLAASMPVGFPRFNLLAQPKHGKYAKDFRKGWIPEKGHILCEWDLSQIELRGLAHLSQDPVLLRAFRTRQDLHAQLALRIFGGKLEDHLKQGYTRFAVKEINFGIPNGMQAQGLCVALRSKGILIDEDDAQKWLDETRALYKGVVAYQERMAAEARHNGFIRCLSGRIRYIGGSNSRDEYVRAEADRLAFSTPIQESAQLIMKRAEIRVWELLQTYHRARRWVEPLLQCHDALTLECEDDPDLAYDLNRQMVHIMTTSQPADFSVPVETSGEMGWNWAEMEAF